MEPFRNLLESDSIHVFDGAMGTMLYAKGVYINRCYDELNISNPDLVREVHAEYCRAGADILETNTFGATAPKLAQYGLEANLHEINVAAARLAREAGCSISIDEKALADSAISLQQEISLSLGRTTTLRAALDRWTKETGDSVPANPTPSVPLHGGRQHLQPAFKRGPMPGAEHNAAAITAPGPTTSTN